MRSTRSSCRESAAVDYGVALLVVAAWCVAIGVGGTLQNMRGRDVPAARISTDIDAESLGFLGVLSMYMADPLAGGRP